VNTSGRDAGEAGRGTLTGARRGADIAYGYLSALFVVGVLVQVYLAGIGIWGINALTVGNASSFAAHRTWGFSLGAVALVLLILALIARQSVRAMIAALVLALLVVVAQSALASAGDSNKWIGGLHALDGMFILLLSAWIAVVAWRRIR
jgi:hypothetical protein